MHQAIKLVKVAGYNTNFPTFPTKLIVEFSPQFTLFPFDQTLFHNVWMISTLSNNNLDHTNLVSNENKNDEGDYRFVYHHLIKKL